jgi:hypothetical protein
VRPGADGPREPGGRSAGQGRTVCKSEQDLQYAPLENRMVRVQLSDGMGVTRTAQMVRKPLATKNTCLNRSNHERARTREELDEL